MKRTIFILLILLTSYFSFSQSHLVYFESDSYALSDDSKQTLNELTNTILRSATVYEIGIIGHTDSDASFQYNTALSRNRAMAVQKYFRDRGLTNRFHLLSKSESQLLNASITDLEKSKNRRVEIILNYSTDNSVYELLQTPYQVYKFPPHKDTLITCLKGTVLDIKKDIFKLKNERSPLLLKVKEFYNKPEFIAGNLSTLTKDDELLESRGMIEIGVYQDGTQLQLKDGSTLDILFKDRKKDDDTSLFIGSKDNNEIVWEQSIDPEEISFTSTGWSVTYIATDTISRSKWWYEDIGDETYKIEYTVENGIERYDTLSVRTEKVMKDLVLSTPKLGWINCDRFFNTKGPKMNLIVEFDAPFTPDASLIFSEINAVLPYSYREDNKLVFRNVPVGMKVAVIAMFKGKDEPKIHFARTDFSTSLNRTESLSFRLIPEEDLKLALESL